MKEQSPIGRIWVLGEKEYGKLICAVLLAVIGVAYGRVPASRRQRSSSCCSRRERPSRSICHGCWRRLAVFSSARCSTTARSASPAMQPFKS